GPESRALELQILLVRRDSCITDDRHVSLLVTKGRQSPPESWLLNTVVCTAEPSKTHDMSAGPGRRYGNYQKRPFLTSGNKAGDSQRRSEIAAEPGLILAAANF